MLGHGVNSRKRTTRLTRLERHRWRPSEVFAFCWRFSHESHNLQHSTTTSSSCVLVSLVNLPLVASWRVKLSSSAASRSHNISKATARPSRIMIPAAAVNTVSPLVALCAKLAPMTSIALYLAPLPTTRNIMKEQTVGSLPLLPQTMMISNAFLWATYGTISTSLYTSQNFASFFCRWNSSSYSLLPTHRRTTERTISLGRQWDRHFV